MFYDMNVELKYNCNLMSNALFKFNYFLDPALKYFFKKYFNDKLLTSST